MKYLVYARSKYIFTCNNLACRLAINRKRVLLKIDLAEYKNLHFNHIMYRMPSKVHQEEIVNYSVGEKRTLDSSNAISPAYKRFISQDLHLNKHSVQIHKQINPEITKTQDMEIVMDSCSMHHEMSITNITPSSSASPWCILYHKP